MSSRWQKYWSGKSSRRQNDLCTLLSRLTDCARMADSMFLFRVRGCRTFESRSHTKLLWRQRKASVTEIRLRIETEGGRKRMLNSVLTTRLTPVAPRLNECNSVIAAQSKTLANMRFFPSVHATIS